MRGHGTENTIDIEGPPEVEPLHCSTGASGIEFEVVFHSGWIEGYYQSRCLDRWNQGVVFQDLSYVLIYVNEFEWMSALLPSRA